MTDWINIDKKLPQEKVRVKAKLEGRKSEVYAFLWLGLWYWQ